MRLVSISIPISICFLSFLEIVAQTVLRLGSTSGFRLAGGSEPRAASVSGVQLQLLLILTEPQHQLLFIVQALRIVYLLG